MRCRVVRPAYFPAELGKDGMDVEIVFLAFIEQGPGRLALLGRQIHILHDAAGHADFIPGDPAVRLADMAHRGEGRGKKGRLDAVLMPAWEVSALPGAAAPAAGLFEVAA